MTSNFKILQLIKYIHENNLYKEISTAKFQTEKFELYINNRYNQMNEASVMIMTSKLDSGEAIKFAVKFYDVKFELYDLDQGVNSGYIFSSKFGEAPFYLKENFDITEYTLINGRLWFDSTILNLMRKSHLGVMFASKNFDNCLVINEDEI